MSPFTMHNARSKRTGFTLVELVIVLIILGVLAATAIPKLTGKSGFEDYAVRDQLIARLRLVQLQGMNADPANDCYWLVVKNECFYQEQTVKKAKKCEKPKSKDVCSDDSYNQYNRVSFTEGMLTTAKYRFQSDGKLSPDSDTSPIIITADNSLTVIIESEGYIHGQ